MARIEKASVDKPLWSGSLLLSPGRALYIGPAGETSTHRHHALQLVVGLDGSFEAEIEGRAPRSVESLWIAGGRGHRIDGLGQRLGFYYVDRSSAEGQAWTDWLTGDSARELGTQLADVRAAFAEASKWTGPAALPGFGRSLAKILGADPPKSPACESAVERAIAILEATLDSTPRVADLARQVGLRQRELSARIQDQIGLSVRRYVLWARLKRAVGCLADHQTLTEAAHAAGFSDAAHLSRTFREMFGVAPSESVGAASIETAHED